MKLQANIAEEFNEFSKNYTDDMVKVVPNYLNLLDCVKNDIPKGFKPKRILDLGCGNGNVTSKLLELFPNAHYTLLDASDQMLAICKAQFGTENKTYIESYFQNYEFKNCHFDMVVAGFSIHHCQAEEKKTILKNIYESLSKNGIFACSDLMINRKTKAHEALLQFWYDYVNKNPSDKESWDWLMEHYYTYDLPESLNQHLKWLRQAGFSEFKTTIYDKYWVHLKAYKS